MRPIAATAVALLAASACDSRLASDPPPLDRFYFPTGIAHVAAPGTAGTLYVASANFDRRFDSGAVTAVSLDAIGLPLPDYLRSGGLRGEFPPEQVFESLGVEEPHRVLISAFAGQMATFATAGGVRLFVPSRAERDLLFVVDAAGPALTCLGGGAERDCSGTASSLTDGALEAEDPANGFAEGKPRAAEPYGVAVRQFDGATVVTHLQPADSPAGSRRNFESYVVSLNAASPEVTADAFLRIGQMPSAGVAIGGRYAYIGGYRFANTVPPALRLIDLQRPAAGGIETQVQGAFRMLDVRDVAVFPPATLPGVFERRIFLLTRNPDFLLVLDVSGASGEAPVLTLVSSVELPEDPNTIRIIPRPGSEGALLAITSTSANAVVLYDDDIGEAVAITGIGLQPFGIAVHAPEGARGARLFVSNFGDGRVTVIDLRDVKNASDARVVARIGRSQECLAVGGAGACGEGVR